MVCRGNTWLLQTILRRIKHLTEVISKGTTPTTIGEDFQDEGVRFLKAENIFGGRVLPDPEFFISERAHAALARSALAENDVLVVIAGATTGKSAVLSGDLLPANTNQAVSFIRLRDTRLSEFIQCWLSTDAVQRSISLNSVQSAQPNLSMEDLGEIPVPLPPLDEIDLITVLPPVHFPPTCRNFIDPVSSTKRVVEFRFQTAGLGQNSVGTWVKNALAVTTRSP